MVKYYMINRALVPASEASLQVSDLALLRGFGIFDFFLVEGGKPVFIDDYIDRFFRSAALLDLEIPMSRQQFKADIFKLIAANGESDAGIRLLLTGGYSDNGYTPVTPNVLILQYPKPAIQPEKFANGVKLLAHQYQRELPEIKTINYVTGIWLRKRLAEAGALEPLYHNGDTISESVRSNFFIVSETGKLITTDQDILRGITRKHLLTVAEKHIEIEKRPIRLQELKAAREAFLTSSTKGVLPVVQIDDLQIGDGRPGPTTIKLGEAFLKYRQTYLDQADSVF